MLERATRTNLTGHWLMPLTAHVRLSLHLNGKAESRKAEANQNSRKTEADKRNVPPITTASSDWLLLFRF